LIVSSEEYDDICSLGKESRDSDSLYSLLQTVTGVEAIVIIRQESPDYCTLGFRSRSWVDVGNIASVLGGGGHKNAAATKLSGTIEELKPQIINAFEQIFRD
jgi:phosphoesterase RecJ-like protein